MIEPSATQQRVYQSVAEPLVGGVLGGVNCALLCVGAAGTGKTHTLYGTEGARADPLGAPRDDWGVAMRACEAFLTRAAPHALAGPLAAAAVSGAQVHASFVEVDGEECYDLLRGGALLTVEEGGGSGGGGSGLGGGIDGPASGGSAIRGGGGGGGVSTARVTGAAQLRLRSLEDAAYTLRLGLRASGRRSVLAPRTHTILTLTVHPPSAGGGDDASAAATAAGNGGRGSRLVLVDLASGDLHGPHRYRLSAAAASQTANGRALAVLGASVAARAEGATRGVPWEEARLASLLRETLAGEFCTAVLGCCGAAESDTQATVSTLHFLLHAGKLTNRVRAPQPPLDSLLKRLRALEERLALQQQKWLERPPPTALPESLHALGRARSRRRPAAAAAAAAARQAFVGHGGGGGALRGLAAQLSVVCQLRERQAAQLQAHARDLAAAVGDAGRQRSSSWEAEPPVPNGLSGAHDVLAKMERAEHLVRALDEWVREADEAHATLRHALSLAPPPPPPSSGGEASAVLLHGGGVPPLERRRLVQG